MSKVLQWTELSLIFFAQAAADIESRALLGLIILSLCLGKSRKIQWLRADAVSKCFQLIQVLSYFQFRNCLEHFLKANLVANASAGSADMVVRPWLTWLWCFLLCCCCSSSASSFSSSSPSASPICLLSHTPKLHPFRVFFGTDFDKTLLFAMFC